MDKLEGTREGMRNLMQGVDLLIEHTQDMGSFVWTTNGDEQVATFGYSVVNEEGQTIARVSTYVHLFDGATPEDFLQGEIG